MRESQVPGAVALRVRSKLTLFALSLSSPCSQPQYLHSRGEWCYSKRGWCGHLEYVRAHAYVVQLGLEIYTTSHILPVNCN